MKIIRRYWAKQSLLRELEIMYLKFEAIYDFLVGKKIAMELVFTAKGLDGINGVRSRFGVVKKQWKKDMNQFEGVKRDKIPEKMLNKIDKAKNEKDELEKMIDDYETVVDSMEKNNEQTIETAFHLRQIKNKSSYWLKEADKDDLSMANLGNLKSNKDEE